MRNSTKMKKIGQGLFLYIITASYGYNFKNWLVLEFTCLTKRFMVITYVKYLFKGRNDHLPFCNP
jgi:hypothetical protein